MRSFVCTCGWRVWFDNTTCLNCKRQVAFSLSQNDMLTLAGPDPDRADVFRVRGRDSLSVRKCRNWIEHGVCNWVVPAERERHLCESCELNEVIPNLGVRGNRWYWYRLEKAKRRLLYGLAQLGLQFRSRIDEPDTGMAFRFVSDDPSGRPQFTNELGQRVLTGHAGGLITINLAEAHDPSRVEMQERMGEDYRTLLGHFRHESGHFYWIRLVQGTAWERDFLSTFGDYSADYERAREVHYQRQQQADTATHFISRYATMHPWEDWAETWAHYLKMVATLETAQSHKMISFPFDLAPELRKVEHGLYRVWTFDQLMRLWIDLTGVTNDLGLSLGYDRFLYPFVLHPPVVEKLRLVHRIIRSQSLTSIAD